MPESLIGAGLTSQPSYMFSALRPDFSVIERLGCHVLDWYICKGKGNRETTMGRRVDVSASLPIITTARG